MSFSPVRPEYDRSFVMSDSVLQTPQRLKSGPNVVMEGGNSWVQGDSLANEIYCDIVAADLMGNDAEKMQTICVIRFGRKNFPVNALSLG